MAKYIDAERLRADLEKRLKNVRDYMNGAGMKYKGPKYFKAQGKESAYDALLNIIDSLQQELQDKITTLNGIKYKEVPAKNDDKICKECDYFLDNGECTLGDDCPCSGDTILERIHKQEQPDFHTTDKEVTEFLATHPKVEVPKKYKDKLISYLLDAPKKDGQYIISSETILEMAREELIKRGVALEELTPEEKADFKNRLTEYFKRAEQKKSPTNYWYLLNAESIFEIAKDVLIKQEDKQ